MAKDRNTMAKRQREVEKREKATRKREKRVQRKSSVPETTHETSHLSDSEAWIEENKT
jgi:vacuolar-type H+-ATPase subunit I/STV1